MSNNNDDNNNNDPSDPNNYTNLPRQDQPPRYDEFRDMQAERGASIPGSGQYNAQRPPYNQVPFEQRDPQITVQGRLKHGQNADVIVFSIPLVFFEIICIVTVPAEGTDSAPTYCKFKINRNRQVF